MKIRMNAGVIYIKKTGRTLYDKILLFFLILSPVVDTVVGMQMRESGRENLTGKIFRLLFSVILLLCLLRGGADRRFKSFFPMITATMLLPFLQCLSQETTEGIGRNFLNLSKLLYPMLLVITFCSLIRFHKAHLQTVRDCLGFYEWYFPLSVIVPYILDVGYSAYETGGGYAGFYSSANELSIVLSVVFILSFMEAIRCRTWVRLAKLLCALLALIMTGTRTAVIVAASTVIFYGFTQKGVRKKIYFIGIISFLAMILIFILTQFMWNDVKDFVARLTFKYTQLGNFWGFLFSNRNFKILPNLERNIWNHRYGALNLIAGRGYFYQVTALKTRQGLASPGLIEMDFWDVLLQYGIFTAVYCTWFYLKIYFSNPGAADPEYKFAFLIVMLFSALAGHVWYSALSGTMLALVCIILDQSRKEEFHNEYE